MFHDLKADLSGDSGEKYVLLRQAHIDGSLLTDSASRGNIEWFDVLRSMSSTLIPFLASSDRQLARRVAPFGCGR